MDDRVGCGIYSHDLNLNTSICLPNHLTIFSAEAFIPFIETCLNKKYSYLQYKPERSENACSKWDPQKIVHAGEQEVEMYLPNGLAGQIQTSNHIKQVVLKAER